MLHLCIAIAATTAASLETVWDVDEYWLPDSNDLAEDVLVKTIESIGATDTQCPQWCMATFDSYHVLHSDKPAPRVHYNGIDFTMRSKQTNHVWFKTVSRTDKVTLQYAYILKHYD